MNTTDLTFTTTIWLQGAPARVGLLAQEIDREVLRDAECEECGTVGLEYRPEHQGRRYRALAVCPCCQCATEF